MISKDANSIEKKIKQFEGLIVNILKKHKNLPDLTVQEFKERARELLIKVILEHRNMEDNELDGYCITCLRNRLISWTSVFYENMTTDEIFYNNKTGKKERVRVLSVSLNSPITSSEDSQTYEDIISSPLDKPKAIELKLDIDKVLSGLSEKSQMLAKEYMDPHHETWELARADILRRRKVTLQQGMIFRGDTERVVIKLNHCGQFLGMDEKDVNECMNELRKKFISFKKIKSVPANPVKESNRIDGGVLHHWDAGTDFESMSNLLDSERQEGGGNDETTIFDRRREKEDDSFIKE